MRRLISTRRRVPAERQGDYLAVWRRVEQAVDPLDAHAWIFRAASDPSLFIEFLEFRGGVDPREVDAVADALGRLDRIGGYADAEEWVDIGSDTENDDGDGHDGP